MGFVGNYALCGLSPQTDGMPVIHKKALQSLKLQGFYLERMMGIEPTTSAWEAEVLPLNYIRKYYSAAFPVF